MAERKCQYCKRPESPRLKLSGMNGDKAACHACVRDVIDKGSSMAGFTAAKQSAAVKRNTCPKCNAKPGDMCTGKGLELFVHSQRRALSNERERLAAALAPFKRNPR